jgi:hypothetical protein
MELREHLLWKRLTPWGVELRGAIGEQVGTEQQRFRFSALIVHSFTVLVEWAMRQHVLKEDAARTAKAAIAARDAIAGLVAQIGTSPDAMALHAKLSPMLPDPAGDPASLSKILRYLTDFADQAAQAQLSAPRSRTGPADTFAVTMAIHIGIAYHQALGKYPAIGRRGEPGRPSPFDRVCDVVEEMLNADGVSIANKGEPCPVTFSDHSKRRAIEEVKRSGQQHARDFATWLRGQVAVMENHRALPREAFEFEASRDPNLSA